MGFVFDQVRQRWFIFDALRKLHEHARLKDRFEALERIFGPDTAHVLRQYVERIDVKRNSKLSDAEDHTQVLYILQSGTSRFTPVSCLSHVMFPCIAGSKLDCFL